MTTSTAPAATGKADGLGVPIELHRSVRILSYGLGARLIDCGRVGQVVGVARTRIRVELYEGRNTFRTVNIDPVCLGVLDDAGRLEGWNQ